MIKTIIFDMGGVLLDLDRARCVAAFERIGFPQADAMLDHYAQTGILGALESGHASPAEFFDYVRAQSRRNTSDGEITDALNAFVVDLPVYKLQMLSDLRPRFGIFMLSNTNAVMMPDIRARYFTQQGRTLDDYFDRTFLSYEMGSIKPDPEIFMQMVRQSGIDPAESLFIDDGPRNIEVAAQLGFHTYMPRPQEDFRHIFEAL